jgi:hypothetical protein
MPFYRGLSETGHCSANPPSGRRRGNRTTARFSLLRGSGLQVHRLHGASLAAGLSIFGSASRRAPTTTWRSPYYRIDRATGQCWPDIAPLQGEGMTESVALPNQTAGIGSAMLSTATRSANSSLLRLTWSISRRRASSPSPAMMASMIAWCSSDARRSASRRFN